MASFDRIEMYDLEKDPWETINVAEEPAYAQARQEMAALLKKKK